MSREGGGGGCGEGVLEFVGGGKFCEANKNDWVKELRAREEPCRKRPRQCRLYIGSASAMYSIPHTCVPATSYSTVRLESADWNSSLLEEDYDYTDENNSPV